MAILDEKRIRNEVKEARKRDVIARARFHQDRIRFHAQTHLQACYTQPVNDFFSFVKNILPHDKYKTFVSMFRWPVATNEITAVCFDKLSRVFDGRNPVFRYNFADAALEEDWEDYRTNELHEPTIWSTEGWERFRTSINSVLICDLPQEQVSERPEPYFYWLPIEDVLAFEADRETGVMEWIIFRQEDHRIAVIDEASYRVFHSRDNSQVGNLETERAHSLGYCPARFFWTTPISLDEPDVKASPLTRELDALDWWLFYNISKRQLDLSGSYPIYSGYEPNCDYSNAENGDYCDGGFLRNRQGHYLYDASGSLLRCPKCGQKRNVGAGSYVEIPIPDGKDQPDLRNPVQILTVDRGSLDYNVSELLRMRSDIIDAVVGTSEEITQHEALNEQQIKANFESQTTVLARVKKGFENAQRFVDETCCRLRYADAFYDAVVDYGTEFFLDNTNTLREQYQTAKESGASASELDAMRSRIHDTEYRNDPVRRRRMETLADLEPFPHMTMEETMRLAEKGIVTPQELRLKSDFSSLVRKFERENMPVTDFGSDLSYDKKINIIKQTLLDYANQN